MSSITSLVGCVLTQVSGLHADSEVVAFHTDDGKHFELSHNQDCCEYVRLIDVIGDPQDLVGSPILVAEERGSAEPENFKYSGDSVTWTFYELATNKGSVTLRWLGESNGYYSERVDFYEVTL